MTVLIAPDMALLIALVLAAVLPLAAAFGVLMEAAITGSAENLHRAHGLGAAGFWFAFVCAMALQDPQLGSCALALAVLFTLFRRWPTG